MLIMACTLNRSNMVIDSYLSSAQHMLWLIHCQFLSLDCPETESETDHRYILL